MNEKSKRQKRKQLPSRKKNQSAAKKPLTHEGVEIIRGGNEQQIIETRVSEYSGPLPPVEDFEGYERVLPGAADRIMTMAEKEQKLRMQAAPRILDNESKQINGAVATSIGMIIVAGLAVWQGFDLLAVFFGAPGLASLIRQIFIWWRESKKPDE